MTKKKEPGTDLINWEEKLAEEAKKATSSERPSSSSIGTKAGILTYNGAAVPDNKLPCIVLASVHANMLYEGSYDPNNLTNPVCYAYSESGNDMKPHPTSSKPQHENCKDCPMNAWGSDPRGGRGKACKNSRHLALIPADTTVEDVPTAEVATLKLPVMSVENWSNYVHKVATLFNRPPLGMVTQISSVPDAKSQFRINFLQLKEVSNELIGALLQRAPSAVAALQRVYEPNDESEVEVPKTPPKKSSKKF